MSNLVRPMVRPMVRESLVRPLVREAIVSFTPATLFSNSEAGAWYDPSDASTLAQNSDGTTSVSVGDPVGYMADKSGNGNHATQSDSGKRPKLEKDANGNYYLQADGVDDLLKNSSGLGIVSLSQFTVWTACVWDATDNDYGLLTLGDRISIRNDAGGSLAGSIFIGGSNTDINTSFTSTDLALYGITRDGDKRKDVTTFKDNDSSQHSGTTVIDPVESTFELFQVVNKSNFFGKFYGAVLLGRLATSSETDNIKNFLADRAGITL